ncbi:MAG: hypothetical protein RLZZ579_407 [Actinomycetota bacterium]
MEFADSIALALVAVLAFGLGAALAAMLMQQKRSREFENLIPSAIALALPGLGQAALIVDAADRFLQYNEQAKALGLVPNGKLTNKKLRSLGMKARAEKPGTKPKTRHMTWQHGKNEYEIQIQALHLGRGQVLILAEDMTAAIKLDQTRRDFVANISHELKTPIGSISLLVEAIQAAIDEPVQLKKFLASLGSEAERLALLVQDIIQLSRVQSTELLAEPKDLSLPVLLAEAVDQTATIAKRQGVDVKISGKTDVTIPGNSEMLVALFKNLLENAINYSKEDSKVNIKVKARDHLVQVAFSDNGIGIPAEDQERIFERFYRVDPSRSRTTGGTGLGLSIAKHIVSQHGGEISVKSKLGKGSTFIVVLPTKEVGKE